MAQSAAEILDRQVKHMGRQVDDLLDVSRISQGKIELRKERADMVSAVNDAVEANRPHLESAGHELTVTLPRKALCVYGDPIRLTQMVGNVLNNACKFTENGGGVWLTVGPEGHHAVVRIRDTGLGIAPEQLGRIFEMFAQVNTPLQRTHTGLGVGLTLVKSLVEMHDGTVEAISAGVGQGSEFVIRLPLLSEPALTQGPTVGAPAVIHSRRVLIADDNRDPANSLATLLQLLGHDVHTANDGLEAVKAAALLQPDVILLDIGMPRLNGYEAARQIREQPRVNGLTLVALTGWGQPEDRRRSEDVGFDVHLTKPVDMMQLTKLLAESGANNA
jgi:CheY-like chemotaxis protein